MIKCLRNIRLSDMMPLVVVLTLLFGMPALLSYRPAGVFHFASAKLGVALLQSLVYAAALALLAGISRLRFLSWLFVLMAALACFVDVFCFLQMGARFNSQALFLVLQTDGREASEFVAQYWMQPKTLAAIAFVAALCGIGLGFRWLWDKMGHRIRRCTTILMLCLLPVSIVANLLPNLTLRFFDFRSLPLQLIMAVGDISDHSKEIAQLRATTEHLTVECVGERPQNIVLVVGESYNKHHSSLYGYDKPTSPLLLEEYEAGRLEVFSDIYSRSSATGIVLHEVFSTDILDKGEEWAKSPLLVSVFDKGGYRVHLFDNHATRQNTSDWDFASTYFHNVDFIDASISERNDSIFAYDADMVRYMARHTDPATGPNLIIVHLMGQHIPARNRYPEDYAEFSAYDYPESYSLRQREEIAYYDNATRYNDYVVRQIIDFFRRYEAIVVYFADHGEEVHDFRDQYGRTMEAPTPQIERCIYQVPFVVWMSDKFVERFPEHQSYIKGIRDRRACNGDVAQLLMRLGGLNPRVWD